MKNAKPNDASSPAELITQQIEELADWRGDLLAQLRQLIAKASPELAEEWKWGTAVWTHNGNVVAAGAFKRPCQTQFLQRRTVR